MSDTIKPGPQAKRVSPELKSKVLIEILVPDAFIPKIAKKYNLSATTLYGWRIDHNKKLKNLKSQQSDTPKGNFIELLPEEELGKSSLSPLPLSPSVSKNKLSEISLMLGSISLSIKGNVGTSSLVKILDALEESC